MDLDSAAYADCSVSMHLGVIHMPHGGRMKMLRGRSTRSIYLVCSKLSSIFCGHVPAFMSFTRPGSLDRQNLVAISREAVGLRSASLWHVLCLACVGIFSSNEASGDWCIGQICQRIASLHPTQQPFCHKASGWPTRNSEWGLWRTWPICSHQCQCLHLQDPAQAALCIVASCHLLQGAVGVCCSQSPCSKRNDITSTPFS